MVANKRFIKDVDIKSKEIELLKAENERLKQELNMMSGLPKDWTRLSRKISSDLKSFEQFGIGAGKQIYNVVNGINYIVRAAFNLKYIRELDPSDYDKAEEIADIITLFIKENYKEK